MTNRVDSVQDKETPSIHFGFSTHMGALHVEVIAARGLVPRPGSKTLKASCVNACLLDSKRCTARKKTKSVKESLDPVYQQVLTFRCRFTGKILQVTVWGKYGRVSYSHFMGVAKILLMDSDLNNVHKSWYELSPTNAACAPQLVVQSPLPFAQHNSLVANNLSIEKTNVNQIPSFLIMPPNFARKQQDCVDETDDKGDFV